MSVAANLFRGETPRSVATEPRQGWVGIWENGAALIAPPTSVDPRPRRALTLCLELVMPPKRGVRPVRLWQGAAALPAAIALYAIGDGRLRLVHGEVDITTPRAFAQAGDTVSLRYRSCARGRGDIVDLWNHDRGLRHRVRAGVAQAARLHEALPRDAGFLGVCHVAAVADFGLSSGALSALASGTVLPTPGGPVPVERLRAGDMLLTAEGEARALRWIEPRPRLCLGRAAPVRLRAPYFGLSQDIRVSPETRILRSGPAVEYNFGHERVLVRAGDLISSPGALRDRRAPVRIFHQLMLDDHAVIAVDRCGVETALLSDVLAAEDGASVRALSQADSTPCLPVLDRAAAQALVAATARGRRALN
jgi:hypothetical protein